MAQFAAPKRFRQDHTLLLIDQDEQGRWTVQDNHGRVEDGFATRADALRFAETERSHHPDAVVIVTPPRLGPLPSERWHDRPI